MEAAGANSAWLADAHVLQRNQARLSGACNRGGHHKGHYLYELRVSFTNSTCQESY